MPLSGGEVRADGFEVVPPLVCDFGERGFHCAGTCASEAGFRPYCASASAMAIASVFLVS